MSKKTLFITFGWTEAPVISSILRYGLSEGDKIVVVLPEQRDERSQAALRDLKSFVLGYAKNIEINEMYISLEDPVDSITRLKNAIESERGKKCIVNLSGGMRAIVILTYLATLFAEHPEITIELETEDRRKVIELPEIRPEDLREFRELPSLAKEIIKHLLSGPIEAPILRKKLKLPPSSFHNIQMKLVQMGYIERERVNKFIVLKLTPRGKLLAKLVGG
jgi:CRISPR locus-related DNA-binding protein